jgi:hypothetical protein
VAADGARQVQHGRDATAAGAGEPGIMVGIGTAGWREPVRVTQPFVQRPSAEQHLTGAAQPGDRLTLLVGPARWVLQQRPAGVLDQLRGGSWRTRASGPGRATPAARRVLFQAARRTSSTAALASLTMWKGSAHTYEDGACASSAAARRSWHSLPLNPTTPAQPTTQPTETRAVPVSAARTRP